LKASSVEQSAERLDDNKYSQTSTNAHEPCENQKQASRVDAPSDRKEAVHLAARFSLRFLLFSFLSFLVKGFFLALRIPNSIAS